MTKVLYAIDLDPLADGDLDDLPRVIERAKREGGYLHIEVRKVEQEPDRDLFEQEHPELTTADRDEFGLGLGEIDGGGE